MLSIETAAFLLFGFFVASLFVSGCIQTFTSASRRLRFQYRQPLHHSLSPVTAFSFYHFCCSHRRLAIQSFTSPSCCHCRLLSSLFVSSSASHSFTSACWRHRRPATRFTSASNSQCQLIVILRVSHESYKSSYRPAR